MPTIKKNRAIDLEVSKTIVLCMTNDKTGVGNEGFDVLSDCIVTSGLRNNAEATIQNCSRQESGERCVRTNTQSFMIGSSASACNSCLYWRLRVDVVVNRGSKPAGKTWFDLLLETLLNGLGLFFGFGCCAFSSAFSRVSARSQKV